MIHDSRPTALYFLLLSLDLDLPDPTHVRARGSGLWPSAWPGLVTNPWARFRMLKRPMRLQSGFY